MRTVILKSVAILLLSLVTSYTQAQLPEKSLKDWIELCNDDFISPLNVKLELAGSFGECRPNHFHTGLDLKTQQKENLPVKSVADGYISRISMSHSGYGHCLYVTHPNGLTTVYAHLNTFSKPIQDYLEQKQAEQESWNVNLYLEEDVLPIKQGEQIALSGNTGGSMAPHLHFEVRETNTDFALNPLAFKAFKVQDNIAPSIHQVGIYNAEQSIYYQKPNFANPTSSGKNQYRLSDITSPHDKVFLSFFVKDFMNESSNWLGIHHLKVFVNDTLHFETKIDAIDLSINRMMNSYIDYTKYRQSKNMFQLAHILPGNVMTLYPTAIQNGVIQLSSEKHSSIRVEIKDYYNNLSTIEFKIKKGSTTTEDNKLANSSLKKWIPGLSQTFKENYFWVQNQQNSFYDTVYFDFNEVMEKDALSANISINNQDIPIHSPLKLAIRLSQPLPLELRSKLVFLHQVRGSNLPGRAAQNAVAAKFDKGYAVADVSHFGNYQIAIDTIPPNIKLLSANNLNTGQALKIEISDNMTQVQHFTAYADDGTWINMKRWKNQFIFIIPKSWNKGTHQIEVWATDANNNTRNEKFQINVN